MKSATLHSVRRSVFYTAAVLGLAAIFAIPVSAQGKKKNPTSKVYVADVTGEAQIDTGVQVDDLNKKSVYNAQGTVIETKPNASNAMVYSNGTGIFFDADTRVEVKKFSQEPFTPNRSDQETEPSISQTHAFVARGSVGLCTSKLVAGSSMTYQTPLGSVNIRGRKVVVESADNVTKISMLEGESTVRGGNLDVGGHTLKAGEQALIRQGPPGQPNIVEIQQIPPDQAAQLDDKVSLACMAKKTVYFEVRDKKGDDDKSGSEATGPLTSDATGKVDDPKKSDPTSENPVTAPVTAFDGDSAPSANTPTTPTRVGGAIVSDGKIIVVPVVPPAPPVQFTVSPAEITNGG